MLQSKLGRWMFTVRAVLTRNVAQAIFGLVWSNLCNAASFTGRMKKTLQQK